MSNTISKYISDARLELVITILEKISNYSGNTTEFQNQLSESLTIAESFFFSIAYHNKFETEEDIDRVVKYTLDPYLDILNLIGVPLTLPMSKMTAKQKSAIHEGEHYIKSIGELKKLWYEANKE